MARCQYRVQCVREKNVAAARRMNLASVELMIAMMVIAVGAKEIPPVQRARNLERKVPLRTKVLESDFLLQKLHCSWRS